MITTSAVSYEQVKDEAPHLPLEDRSRLASRLLESLDDEDDVGPEWKDEIDRRLQEIDEGKAVMIPHAEVMPNVRGSLAKNRELRASNGALTLAQCLFEFGFLHHQGCEMIFSRVGACFGGIEPARK
jgi:putative addiction module component (TIGR02574 family)